MSREARRDRSDSGKGVRIALILQSGVCVREREIQRRSNARCPNNCVPKRHKCPFPIPQSLDQSSPKRDLHSPQGGNTPVPSRPLRPRPRWSSRGSRARVGRFERRARRSRRGRWSRPKRGGASRNRPWDRRRRRYRPVDLQGAISVRQNISQSSVGGLSRDPSSEIISAWMMKEGCTGLL